MRQRKNLQGIIAPSQSIEYKKKYIFAAYAAYYYNFDVCWLLYSKLGQNY